MTEEACHCKKINCHLEGLSVFSVVVLLLLLRHNILLRHTNTAGHYSYVTITQVCKQCMYSLENNLLRLTFCHHTPVKWPKPPYECLQ